MTVVRALGRRRRRVLDLVRGHLRLEAGEIDSLSGASRVALLAHWSDRPRVTLSFRRLVAELDRLGYRIVVVSAATCPGPLEWEGDLPAGATVIRKPNVGYDFGSWAVGMAAVPHVLGAERVVVANDSLVGPFSDLDHLVASFEGSRADIWGFTETRQFFPHLQSYFLGFSDGVLRDKPIARFWRDIRQEPTKQDIIWRNELGLARLVRAEGYSIDAAYLNDDVVAPGLNPTIIGWENLLRRGFPFVKREIVTRPEVAPGADRVAARVWEQFGARLGDWV